MLSVEVACVGYFNTVMERFPETSDCVNYKNKEFGTAVKASRIGSVIKSNMWIIQNFVLCQSRTIGCGE